MLSPKVYRILRVLSDGNNKGLKEELPRQKPHPDLGPSQGIPSVLNPPSPGQSHGKVYLQHPHSSLDPSFSSLEAKQRRILQDQLGLSKMRDSWRKENQEREPRSRKAAAEHWGRPNWAVSGTLSPPRGHHPPNTPDRVKRTRFQQNVLLEVSENGAFRHSAYL